MKYRGREIDPVRLWENYVDFPHNLEIDGKFLSKVVCPNPEHDTTKRHFQINVTDGLVHCFAHCGISGTFEHALCVIHGFYQKHRVEDALDNREKKRRTERARKEARRIILRATTTGRSGVSLSKSSTVGKSQPITTVSDLGYETRIPPVGIEYLEGRGITSETIAAWELGWDADEKRIVIPAKDIDGHLRFLIKRAVTDRQWPKYLYTEGFPKTSLLFGACQIDPRMIRSDGLILVEGSLDAIWLWHLGFRNVCAILGTGISKKQAEIIARWRPRRIYFMFDRDTAGVRNIEIASIRLRKYPLFVCRYPKGKTEPDGLTRREADRVIARSLPISKFRQRYPNAIRNYREVLSGSH